MRSLLLIDDDVQNLEMLTEFLASRYQVRSAADPRQGVALALSQPPDLVVCDIDMPQMNGFEVCEAIRTAHPRLPVLFLTSDPQASTMQRALSAGGSDYVVKPFRLGELLNRIELRLGLIQTDAPIVCGNLRLDPARLDAVLDRRGKIQRLQLTELGFRVLETLVRNVDTVLSREQIMRDAWSGHEDASDRSVDLHVFRLRKQLRGWDHGIHAVYGRGYRVEKK